MPKQSSNQRPPRAGLSLAGAKIVLPRRAGETARFAAAELARYLFLLTRKVSPVVSSVPSSGPAVLLGGAPARKAGVGADAEQVGDQGYRLAVAGSGRGRRLAIAATTDVGTLYGVYGLLEELGMGFYAGGETFPETPTRAIVPADLDRCDRPAFRIRGNMLHYNFLCGCTDWRLNDYKFYFDQLARMRCNMLLMHWYDGEPGAAYEVDGEYLTGGGTPNSLTKPWGAVESLRTSQFSFGSGRLFDAEVYTSDAGEDLPDLLTEIKQTERTWAEATRYARTAGIQIAAGFEAPRDDPTAPAARKRFRARVRQFLARNPHITHFALWQHESGACYGTTPPAPGWDAREFMEKRRERFAHLGNDRRIWEAIRYGAFAEMAAELLAKEAPHLRLVVVGWGGNRWMRFSDLCLAYDKLLPPSVIFTCHDNIDASFGPRVSDAWGELPAERERWAMPWVEGDVDDCQVRQPNVESLGSLTPDALAKGAQGMLTLQWRTRDVEEETGYIARFAWNPKLTPDAFYRDLARHSFGCDHERDMGRMLGTLQRFGARWTGVRGTSECGRMDWAGGFDPHLPWDLDAPAASMLARMAADAADALSLVPSGADVADGGAYHERTGDADASEAVDETRPGVQETRGAAKRLRALACEPDEAKLRAELIDIEEQLWTLRPTLVAFGMTSPAYRAFDGFMIALHHMQRNAGTSRKMPQLRRMRRKLADLRCEYVRAGRVARLERLDYLAATMDFVLGFDSVVMLLAKDEWVDRACAAAAEAAEAGDADRAAEIAGGAYAKLVEAGMQGAIEAFGRKLTTRCDFGTLTTLNVKPLPRYWGAVAKLEQHMPAAGPREVHARGQLSEVWLSWDRAARADALHLYRRAAGTRRWKRVNKRPLAGTCRMFVDRPAAEGAYEYAVTALSESGWESPRSHVGRAVCGRAVEGPRIVAAKPHARVRQGEPLTLTVVVLSDREVAAVELLYRPAGQRSWSRAAMQKGYRHGYRGTVPPEALAPGVVEFVVEATDGEGNRSVWPASARAGLPWTLVVADR